MHTLLKGYLITDLLKTSFFGVDSIIMIYFTMLIFLLTTPSTPFSSIVVSGTEAKVFTTKKVDKTRKKKSWKV